MYDTETTKMVSSYHNDPNYQSSIPVGITRDDDSKHKKQVPSNSSERRVDGIWKYGSLHQLMTIFVVVLVVVVMVSISTDKSNKTYWVDTNPDGANMANIQWTDRFGTVHTKSWTTTKTVTNTMSISNSGRWWQSTNKDGEKMGNFEWKDHLGNTHKKSWTTTSSKGLTTSVTNPWWNGWTQKDYAGFWAAHGDEVNEANKKSNTDASTKGLTTSVTNPWWNGWTHKDYANYWATPHDDEANNNDNNGKSNTDASSITNSWWNGWTNKDYADYWATHNDEDNANDNGNSHTESNSHEFWEDTDANGITTYNIQWTDRFGIVHQQNWTNGVIAPDATAATADTAATATAVETP